MPTEKQKTVLINGRRYDALTGLPVESAESKQAKAAPTAPKKPVAKSATKPVKASTRPAAAPVPGKRPAAPRSSHAIHAAEPQRSQTLNRRVARKNTKVAAPRPATGRTMDIGRSSRIARFAPHPTEAKTHAVELHTSSPDRPHRPHPMTERAMAQPKRPMHPRSQAHTEAQTPHHTAPVTTQEIKNAAIAQAMAREPAKQPRKKKISHRRRNFLIGIACAILVAGAAYVTYMNLPVLSVSLASAQAGIKASYPSYTPDGYRLEQPITFNEGEVTLKFLSNGGSGGYAITQERSSWDSSAVLTNIVQKKVGDDYSTIKDSGLTIYTYQGNAAWVNAGILYTISNEGQLSSQQVNDIASSL